MTRQVDLQGRTLPSWAHGEANVEIHTRIQFSASAGKPKAIVCFVFHCGQNFCVNNTTTWIVPVWVTTLREEGLASVAELVIDAQPGAIVESEDHCRTLRRLGNALLSASLHSYPNLFRRIVLHSPDDQQANSQGRSSCIPPAIK